jgi:hypothetical protein
VRSSLFWDITQRRLVVTDFSEQPVLPIFKDQSWPLSENHNFGTTDLIALNKCYVIKSTSESEHTRLQCSQKDYWLRPWRWRQQTPPKRQWLPSDVALYTIRLEYSSTPLGKPQISHVLRHSPGFLTSLSTARSISCLRNYNTDLERSVRVAKL